MAAAEPHYGWFNPDPQNPATYYQELIARRQVILGLDCNTRGKMAQEWLSLIIEMDAVMRVCHTHLGTVEFNRPRTRSFRGESFCAPGPGEVASHARAKSALAYDVQVPSHVDSERVAIGYLRLPVTTDACRAARGQTLQRPVVLRQFWRHPSWPDPDTTFIWQQQHSSDDRGDVSEHARAASYKAAMAGPDEVSPSVPHTATVHRVSGHSVDPSSRSSSPLKKSVSRGARSPLRPSRGPKPSSRPARSEGSSPVRSSSPTRSNAVARAAHNNAKRKTRGGRPLGVPSHVVRKSAGGTAKPSSVTATQAEERTLRDVTPSPPNNAAPNAGPSNVPRKLLPVTVDL